MPSASSEWPARWISPTSVAGMASSHAPGSKPRLWAPTTTLLTSISRPQPLRRASSARKLVSLQLVAAQGEIVGRVLDQDLAARARPGRGRYWRRSGPAPRWCAGPAAGRESSGRRAATRRDAPRHERRLEAVDQPLERGEMVRDRARRLRLATCRRRAATAAGRGAALRAWPAAGRRRPCNFRHGLRTTAPPPARPAPRRNARA